MFRKDSGAVLAARSRHANRAGDIFCARAPQGRAAKGEAMSLWKNVHSFERLRYWEAAKVINETEGLLGGNVRSGGPTGLHQGVCEDEIPEGR